MKILILLAVVLWGTGCQMGYYAHLAKGQWELSRQAESFSWWEENSSDTELHTRLQQTRDTLVFATDVLGFDTGRLYQRYVELDRPYVVWSLTATTPFSFEPYQWCYPLVGCAPYKGFFSQQRLLKEKQRLEARGYEVYVFGAQAYSTLGWFRDPVTNLMLSGDQWENAELLLHELTHAHYYRKGDTTFNESLATAVARVGVGLWLEGFDHAELDARQQAWVVQDQMLQDVALMVAQSRSELSELYEEPLPPLKMSERQAQIRERLRERFRQARIAQPGLSVYEGWFSQPLSNAQLNLMHFYQGQVSVFMDLYERVGGDWQAFWSAVRAMPALETEK